MWMLDTNTCSYIFRKHPRGVAERFAQKPAGQIALSSVVLGELYYGLALLQDSKELRAYLQAFVGGLTLLAWDAAAAEHYGDIRARLEEKGTPIGSMDMMIAAHARSADAVLVTNNMKHFRRVPGLRVENWV